MAGLSTEAKAGKILFLVGIVVGWALVLLLLFSKAASFPYWLVPRHLLGDHVQFVVALKILGLILATAAMYCIERMYVQRAGIIGLIATLLPPVDLLFFLGSLLLLVSPEGRGSPEASSASQDVTREEGSDEEDNASNV